MGSESGGRSYNLTEIFAIKFVLADVLIIAALLLAGPLYALGMVALFVASTFLIWYLTRRSERADADRAAERERDAAEAASERAGDASDPVTRLQERYAAGELSEAEFEAKLDRLIESNERADAAGVETETLELEQSE
ncbi:SHOCT domain-containing protein [Haloterrigena sp. SYSU A558-1]|uniref:SHOCT domain-containing protein n=1 Tax=Haloterrigena gelatinilytica TaxID=2741724 RepID=A0A8J8GMI6_9EURY|nr:SHOCT domain-containing protein [Haloterrigena gelatinilytica]NUB91890.1 SHOCT domain-containing protein [Haloterrigena gelatinilytica]NUC72285.1 SHOCT domain-containing protein [Haloterrigena gelatinilytica]